MISWIHTTIACLKFKSAFQVPFSCPPPSFLLPHPSPFPLHSLKPPSSPHPSGGPWGSRPNPAQPSGGQPDAAGTTAISPAQPGHDSHLPSRVRRSPFLCTEAPKDFRAVTQVHGICDGNRRGTGQPDRQPCAGALPGQPVAARCPGARGPSRRAGVGAPPPHRRCAKHRRNPCSARPSVRPPDPPAYSSASARSPPPTRPPAPRSAHSAAPAGPNRGRSGVSLVLTQSLCHLSLLSVSFSVSASFSVSVSLCFFVCLYAFSIGRM